MAKETRNFRIKMHQVCSNDELRPVLNLVSFQKGYMMATNAHILIKARLAAFTDFDQTEIDALDGKFLTQEQFKNILSHKMVEVGEEGIQSMTCKTFFPFHKTEEKYVNVGAVIPNESIEVNEIGLTPALAKDIFSVMNTGDFSGVVLRFSGKNKMIKMFPMGYTENDMVAGIMPILIQDDLFTGQN